MLAVTRAHSFPADSGHHTLDRETLSVGQQVRAAARGPPCERNRACSVSVIVGSNLESLKCCSTFMELRLPRAPFNEGNGRGLRLPIHHDGSSMPTAPSANAQAWTSSRHATGVNLPISPMILAATMGWRALTIAKQSAQLAQ